MVILINILKINSDTDAPTQSHWGRDSHLLSGLFFMHKTHGLSKSPLYKLWTTVKNRCYNKNDRIYSEYGGRGVRMCSEWRDNPESFMDWCKKNGWRKGLQIDKDIIAMSQGLTPNLYSPERCQFVTPKKNGTATRKSRLIECNGVTRTLAEWSDELGISRSTILMRLDVYGYSVDQALTKGWRGRKITK